MLWFFFPFLQCVILFLVHVKNLKCHHQQNFLGHFVQSNLQQFIQTFIHWWRWLPCKVPTSTSGAVWGSVSCPKTLHADQGDQTSDLPITRRRLYPWATAAHKTLLLKYLSSRLSLYSVTSHYVKHDVCLAHFHHYWATCLLVCPTYCSANSVTNMFNLL